MAINDVIDRYSDWVTIIMKDDVFVLVFGLSEIPEFDEEGNIINENVKT
jgi:hypothetical protein